MTPWGLRSRRALFLYEPKERGRFALPMDSRDNDIEFDFFDEEPATTEAQSPQSRVRLPRRGGRGPGAPGPAGPPRGLTPLLCLLALIAIILAGPRFVV